MEIKNIILSKYFELKDKHVYDYVLNYSVDSKDLFNIGDFTNLTFGQVKELQLKFSKGATINDVINFIVDVANVDIKEVGKIKFLSFTQAYNFIKNQIDFINTIEENGLLSDPDPKAEQAGVDRFDKYGYWIQINNLSGNDILKHEAIKQLLYIDCFTKLRYDCEYADYEKILNKINNRRNGEI